MKTLFVVISVWIFTISAQAEFCNWGFVGPKIFDCEGEKYYFGTAACDSGVYKDIFCNERLSQDGKACRNDTSKKTQACYKKFKSAKPSPK